jgi:putative ABC transport system permease protein
MRLVDTLLFGLRAATGYPTRTLLMLLAMAIGVGSVVVLSSLGESAKDYVVAQFSSLGTNLLIVLPGRSETVGGPPPLLGVTPRDLTLADAEALQRSALIRYVAPISVGAAPVSHGAREREVTILGSTPELYQVRQLSMAQGKFLPEGEIDRAAPVCVLGYTMREELFGGGPVLGEWVRIDDRRFRVIGVLAKKGESVGLDMGEVVIIPVASAQALFNTNSLFRIMVEANDRDIIARVKETILRIIRERHEGEDDVTVITQDAVLATFNRIFRAMILTVAGIGAISISVAGILIMNVMLIAVSQRRAEVGLLKAIGATGAAIVILFVAEAMLLSLVGAGLGLLVGGSGIWLIGIIFPAFPLTVPSWSLAAAVTVALAAGLCFGILPALRAARLDPVNALSRR